MQHPDPFAVRDLAGPLAATCRRALTGESGVSLPPLVDHHVHVHLIDERALAAHGIAGALDLGGDPVALAQRAADAVPRVAYSGAFLTAPGGYPAGRPWAPASVVREVSSASMHAGIPGGAATAVDEQAEFGASVVKISLNAAAGPVFDRATLDAVVAVARERGLATVAHVEGEGMTRLALEAGIDALAHTPFAERLEPDLVVRAVAAGQRWISTLDIHRDDPDASATARANLQAFVDAGGTALYGTDLGNGDLPPGVNGRELAALDEIGLSGARLVAALTDPWPRAEPVPGVSTFIAGPAPADLDGVPAWLARAVVVPTEELVHDAR